MSRTTFGIPVCSLWQWGQNSPVVLVAVWVLEIHLSSAHSPGSWRHSNCATWFHPGQIWHFSFCKCQILNLVSFVYSGREKQCFALFCFFFNWRIIALQLVLVSAISSFQSLSCVWLFVTPWTAAHQASLSITNSQSLLTLTSIELVTPSNHLILHHPLLLLPSTFPSIRIFSNESLLRIRWPKYWSFSFSISPSSEYSGLISFRMDWIFFRIVWFLPYNNTNHSQAYIHTYIHIYIYTPLPLEPPSHPTPTPAL